MAVLRSQDNKIVRNLSGEILRTPPIIDISSDFGVTKDGANLVSKVRNGVNPNVLIHQPTSNTIIENGDGFELANGGALFSFIPIDLVGKDWDYYSEFKINGYVNSSRSMYIYKFGVNDITKIVCYISFLVNGNVLFYVYDAVTYSLSILNGTESAHLYSNTRQYVSFKKRGSTYYWSDGVNNKVFSFSANYRFVRDASIILGTPLPEVGPSLYFNGNKHIERLTIL